MNLKHTFVLLALSTYATVTIAAPPESCGINDPITEQGIPDSDSDEVANSIDNCVDASNVTQLDTDNDGYGNHCDADYNNDGFVNFLDIAQLQGAFNTANANLDLTGDAFINFLDLARFSELFNNPPGPNGACIANPSSCAGPAYFEIEGDLNPGNPDHQFVLEMNAPEEIYHARRFVTGASTCNGQVAANIVFVTESYNASWSYSMTGGIDFHGSNIEPIEACDATTTHIENNGVNWCTTGGGDTRQSGMCDYWCPWSYTLTQEIFPTL